MSENILATFPVRKDLEAEFHTVKEIAMGNEKVSAVRRNMAPLKKECVGEYADRYAHCFVYVIEHEGKTAKLHSWGGLGIPSFLIGCNSAKEYKLWKEVLLAGL